MSNEQSPGATPAAIVELEARPRANFQFVMPPSEVEKLYGALYSVPQVEIYNDHFIDPFTALALIVSKSQNELVMRAILEVDESFDQKYGPTIGSPEAVKTLQKRYPQGKLSGDHTTFVALRRDQPIGVIQRVDEKHILILRGANAGPITLSEDHPVNDLKMEVDQFLLLAQRFVTSHIQSSDANHREVNLVLNLPQLTEEALKAFHSSFEIMGKEFRVHHRELDLDTEIGGFPRLKTRVKGLYIDITDPETSRRFGNQPFSNRFVLITGPKGSGKSLFPKALDTMLSKKYGRNFEHYRFPLIDMFQKYGDDTATTVKTILDHIRENEKKGVFTALHVDQLDALCPPDSDAGIAALLLYRQLQGPVLTELRKFGNDLGPAAHHTVVLGESRAQAPALPEAIQRIFRSSYNLRPTREDLAAALVVQIATTRRHAKGSGVNPVNKAVDLDPLAIIPEPGDGLTGKDIQDAILAITADHKTSGRSARYLKITPEKIRAELLRIQMEKSITLGIRYAHLGFNTSSVKH